MPNYQIKIYDYDLEGVTYCIGGTDINLLYLSYNLEEALRMGQDVDVHISSVGGSAFEAIGMYDALKKYPGNVTTYIDSLAASAASIVAMAGKTVVMSKYAMLMIHKPMVGSGGNADDLEADVKMLNIVQSRLAGIYMDKTSMSEDEINELINATTWMTAEQALELGFIDRIEDYEGGEITNLAKMLQHVEASAAPKYCKKVFNKLSTIQNTNTMITDKATIDKNTSVLEKILNYFKKSEIKTVSNKGGIKSYAPLAKGVAVTNDADEDLEDGDYCVENAGEKVVYNVKGGMVENVVAEKKADTDTDEDVQNAAVLNSVNLKVTNKAEAAGIAKVVSNHIATINSQNALIAELSGQLKVTNELVARDEETIKADIKSTFTPDGSKRSDTSKVNNTGAMPKFISDKLAGNKMLDNAVKIAQNSAK